MKPRLALVVTTLSLAGCASDPNRGYAMQSAHNDQVHSIMVPVFANNTFEHGLEAELADAIIREIRRTTAWSVTRDAQTALTGTIVDASLTPLSTVSGTGLTQDAITTIRVDFAWKHNRTGKMLAERAGFSGSGTFVAARPVAERYEHGRRTAVERLARDIVAELRSNW